VGGVLQSVSGAPLADMTRALIIDDDALSRLYLQQLLAAHPDVEICGETTSLESARELIANDAFDLIFLDISLADGSGFDLAAEVPPSTRVIIVSAHPEFALRAFDVNALDYLVKPVTPSRLATTLARREQRVAAPRVPADEFIHLRDGNRSRIVRIADICAIEAEENYTRVHLTDATTVLVRRPLKNWEDLLPAHQFIRIHRNGVINLSHLKNCRRDESGGMLVEVHSLSKPWPVGRTFWPTLRRRLAPGAGSLSPFPLDSAAG
jgi:two-component system LytT family response regulator